MFFCEQMNAHLISIAVTIIQHIATTLLEATFVHVNLNSSQFLEIQPCVLVSIMAA